MALPEKKSDRVTSRKIQKLEAQAQEYQDKADKHHNSVYILLIICTATIDLLGGLGFGLLALLLSPAVWLLNGFLWLNQRELWEIDDYATAFVTSIMESIPGLDVLPAATGNALQKWIRSGMRAMENQSKADDYNSQLEGLRKKQRAQRLYSQLPRSQPPPNYTAEKEERTPSNVKINEATAKNIFALPRDENYQDNIAA